jgi:tetratricopeptide (TPR) repeat protein
LTDEVAHAHFVCVQSRPFNLAETMQTALDQHRQGRLREAEKLYKRVLKAVPENFDALHLLGLIKAQTGQMGEAYRLMSAALKINTRTRDAWMNFANVLHALKRDDEALAALDSALALTPGDSVILQNRGNALVALGRHTEAVAAFDQVLAQSSHHVDALINRGAAHATLKNFGAAIADLNAALALNPNHSGALYNLGNALLENGRIVEALTALDGALRQAPEHAQSWNNRGRALQSLNRHREAVASFDKAIALQKDYGDAHFNRALSLLSLGDLAQGFLEYEWRWKRSGMADTRRNYRGQPWLGDYPPARKTILLHAEQGLGDTLQFARYAVMLADAGATVRLEIQKPLNDLLATLPGVSSVHVKGEPLPAYDIHCPFGSLPLACKTTATNVPATIPYLRADETRSEKWRRVIEPLPGLRVMIAWAGNPAHANDRNRSIALETLAPLFDIEGASFVSVQRGLRAGDEEQLARYPRMTHIGAALDDMADTAAVLALGDLLIAVDTAVAHLALAMGHSAWVILPFAPDWRWESDSGQSLWYPRARLFRQPALGDWPSVVAALREALAQRVAEP